MRTSLRRVGYESEEGYVREAMSEFSTILQ